MKTFNNIKQLLLFKISKEEIFQFSRTDLSVGIIGTWIVGMGRYWDDPGAKLLQHLGLGSVIYVFALALLIWIIIYPYKIKNWNYFTVITFISLTSFPAILYAIPVERFVSMQMANRMNVWFLAIVAIWRLALLFYFLRKTTELHIWYIITITLFPICLIISTLTALNLHRVVFNIMSGIRVETPHDSAYFVLLGLTGISLILIGPLIITYIVGIVRRRREMNENN